MLRRQMAPFTNLSWLGSSVLVLTCETRRTRTRCASNWLYSTGCFSHTRLEFTDQLHNSVGAQSPSFMNGKEEFMCFVNLFLHGFYYFVCRYAGCGRRWNLLDLRVSKHSWTLYSTHLQASCDMNAFLVKVMWALVVLVSLKLLKCLGSKLALAKVLDTRRLCCFCRRNRLWFSLFQFFAEVPTPFWHALNWACLFTRSVRC